MKPNLYPITYMLDIQDCLWLALAAIFVIALTVNIRMSLQKQKICGLCGSNETVCVTTETATGPRLLVTSRLCYHCKRTVEISRRENGKARYDY
jgi:hypothetical protein